MHTPQNVTITTSWKNLKDCPEITKEYYKKILVPLPEWNGYIGTVGSYWYPADHPQGRPKAISEQEAQKAIWRVKKVLNRLKKRGLIDKDLVKLVKEGKNTRYEIGFVTASWEWSSGSEKAHITGHKPAKLIRKIRWASCYDSDSSSYFPAMWMKGVAILANGREIQLSGTRDVGIRTGYPPSMSLIF